MDTTADNFTVAWAAISGADSYNIYINGSLNESTVLTSKLIMLWNNGTYSITVTAVNGDVESLPSSPIEIIVAIPPKIDGGIPPQALDGVYISIVVAFAIGIVCFLSMKNRRKGG